MATRDRPQQQREADAAAGLPPPAPDAQALAARVAELEAELARLRQAPPPEQPPAPAAAREPSYWTVSLKHQRTHTVLALDMANAWEQYRRELGVLATVEAPEARPGTRAEWEQSQARRLGLSVEDWRAAGHDRAAAGAAQGA